MNRKNISNNEIVIIQWNSRSLNSNKHYLQNYLNSNKVDIVILSEIWLKPSSHCHFKGYNFISKRRENGKGGVGILITNSLAYQEVNLTHNINNNNIEICAIKLDSDNVHVISLYKPPNVQATANDWNIIFSQFTGELIIGGDFNAQNRIWGSAADNEQGKRLVDALDNCNLVVLNDGSPTRIIRPNQNHSAVDLTLSTASLAIKSTWNILEDNFGSDHYPIKITIGINTQHFSSNPSSRWKDTRADWNIFADRLDTLISTSNTTENQSETLTQLIQNISNAADAAIPIKRPLTSKSSRPIWWDEECYDIMKSRLDALKTYKSISNFDNYLKFQKLDAQAKRTFHKKRRNSWKNFISKLNKSTPISNIWTYIKKIANKNPNVNKQPIPTAIIDEHLNKIAPPTATNNQYLRNKHYNNMLDNPFNLDELNMALKNARNTAPGMDNITSMILLNLTGLAKHLLLNVYNNWWLQSEYTETLKEIVIILVKKPQNYDDPLLAHRSISLLSCLMKTFERMIKARLEWFVEHNSLLPKSQFGFRRGMGTNEAVAQLVTDAQVTFSKNYFMATLFVDIKGAYDAVDLTLL